MKKRGTTHKLFEREKLPAHDSNRGSTECGVDVVAHGRYRKSWKGVRCQKCLRRKRTTRIWTGAAVTSSFSNAANWTPRGKPKRGDICVFPRCSVVASTVDETPVVLERIHVDRHCGRIGR